MELENRTSYRSIVKGTAIFGGTQVFNILINVIRGKLVAMILGPAGMGVTAIFSSAISPIQQFSTFGLPYSAVQGISSENNEERKRNIVRSFRIIMRIAACIGSIITIMLSPLLSELSFGNKDYTWSFVFLSLAVFFFALNQGCNTVLQGYRRLKSLALCSIVGSIAGLVVCIPLYYFYGVEGVIPSMILLALISYLVSYYGIRKIKLKTAFLSWKCVWDDCKNMVALGLTMMIAVVLGNLYVFSLNSFIRFFGSLADVGLFQAANTIINQYMGMVFAAMATDFYPHLSSIIKDRNKTIELVKEQGEITLFVVAPIAVLIIITAPLIIEILLTHDFISVLSIIKYMGLGAIAKAAVFPLGYLSIAHGDKAYYFMMEGVFANVKGFVVFAGFYYLWGFEGLGVAALFNSCVDIIIAVLMNKWRYNITYDKKFMIVMLCLFFVASICLLCSFISNVIVSYVTMILIGSLLSLYCFKELDKRIDIRNIIVTRIPKRKLNENS